MAEERVQSGATDEQLKRGLGTDLTTMFLDGVVGGAGVATGKVVAEHDDPEAITIYEARWYSASGALGLREIPAIRIPLGAVTAWWVAGGVAFVPPKAEADRGKWLAGVVFDLD